MALSSIFSRPRCFFGYVRFWAFVAGYMLVYLTSCFADHWRGCRIQDLFIKTLSPVQDCLCHMILLPTAAFGRPLSLLPGRLIRFWIIIPTLIVVKPGELCNTRDLSKLITPLVLRVSKILWPDMAVDE